MIIEILDQIIDSYLDKSNPDNLAHKGCVLKRFYLGENVIKLLIIELQEKLPADTEFNYLEVYRGILIDESGNMNALTPVYEIKKP